MATNLPRAARSVLSGAAYRQATNHMRLQFHCSVRSQSISSTARTAASPNPPYVRKANNGSPPPAKQTPAPAKAAAAAPRPAQNQAVSMVDDQSPIKDMSSGLADEPIILDEDSKQVDWGRSFHGLSTQPFSKEAADILLTPIPFDDVEVKPDGIIYFPEIKYRRVLNRAFGPGGWGLAPRGETIVTPKSITREYALVAHGRLVSVARGEQQYFDPEGIPTATEGCKSNALMRCCKDLGVASELWDPRYIRKFMKEKAKQVWVEHVVSKKKKQIWIRKDDEVRYPFKESKFGA
ncbi:maintenance protein MGM101 [Glarea lozoyensis ATCC 20868]|uniref:Mitochondrial genome maintenance protein MGM101 n=1 Tax=Glarea lozoyensis (strain ATCC 20868 / MF5171) TaxID=1116229 RepID=S3CTJ1_GLAL2|nr:maintenance protein MGM101 [Glarea lozoyensis ATCC 20868]EPE28980.1 maintenance protein MGM101 [Glarea lozoyensis ATCC 20868]